MESKILGIDYGEKRVGLAISDENRKIAFPLKTLENKSQRYLLEEIKKICAEEEVEKIVVGLPIPKKEEAVISQSLEAAKKFIQNLKTELIQKIETEDEILSTKMAKRLSFKNKDATAAMLILESYLEKER